MQERVKELLAEVGAVLEGHFVYTSDRHGSAYINKDAVYPHTLVTKELCNMMAQMFVGRGIEVVVGPALGGITLSQRVTEFLEMHNTTHDVQEVLAVFAEKHEDGHFLIKRGQEELIPGRRVLVTEDIFTTGGSAKSTVDIVRALGGDVCAVTGLVNRGGVTAEDLEVPEFRPLLELDLQSWDEEECELCRQGIPVNTEIGHGEEFLARQGAD